MQVFKYSSIETQLEDLRAKRHANFSSQRKTSTEIHAIDDSISGKIIADDTMDGHIFDGCCEGNENNITARFANVTTRKRESKENIEPPSSATSSPSPAFPPSTKPATPDSPRTWREGTVLIAGDSMISGLDGTRMSYRRKVLVKSDGGCNIQELQHHLDAWLPKRPSTVILHIGTNESPSKTSNQIYNELLDLKKWIASKSRARVIFSIPICRFDDAKATLTVKQLQGKLLKSGELEVIDNSNIGSDLLGRKKLHFNFRGTKQLAVNIIQKLKSL